jgi:hypothetical protein
MGGTKRDSGIRGIESARIRKVVYKSSIKKVHKYNACNVIEPSISFYG